MFWDLEVCGMSVGLKVRDLPSNQPFVIEYSAYVFIEIPSATLRQSWWKAVFSTLASSSSPFLLRKMCWYIKTSRMERVKPARERVISPPRCSMQLCRALHLSGLESPTSLMIFLLLFWSFWILEFSSVTSFKAIVLVWWGIYSIQRNDNNNSTDVFQSYSISSAACLALLWLGSSGSWWHRDAALHGLFLLCVLALDFFSSNLPQHLAMVWRRECLPHSPGKSFPHNHICTIE